MKLVDGFLLSLPGRELKHREIKIKKNLHLTVEHKSRNKRLSFQRFCTILCLFKARFPLTLGAAASAHCYCKCKPRSPARYHLRKGHKIFLLHQKEWEGKLQLSPAFPFCSPCFIFPRPPPAFPEAKGRADKNFLI